MSQDVAEAQLSRLRWLTLMKSAKTEVNEEVNEEVMRAREKKGQQQP